MKKRPLLVALFVIVGAALLITTAGCSRPTGQSGNPQADASTAPAGQPVRVSGELDAAEPAIAAARDIDGANGMTGKSVYVAWVEHRGEDADVMLREFDHEGQPSKAAVRVNPKPGVATAWRGDPPTVATGPDGTVYVGWTARVDSASGHATDLYLSASHDRGKNFAAPFKVNDDQKPAVHGMHSLAVAKDGRIYIAWLDERSINQPQESSTPNMPAGHMESNREVFVSSSADDGRSFSTNKRIAKDACPCCKTSLAIGKDGRLYLSWRQVLQGDFRHIALSSSVDGGNTFNRPVIVSDDQWVLKGCPVTGAALLPEENGNLRVLWYAAGEKGERGIYWSESTDGGETFAPRALLSPTSARGTPALVSDGVGAGTWGVWEGSETGTTQVRAARFADIKPANKTAVLAEPGELPAAAAAGDQVFIAYIVREDERTSIWLVTARKNRESF